MLSRSLSSWDHLGSILGHLGPSWGHLGGKVNFPQYQLPGTCTRPAEDLTRPGPRPGDFFSFLSLFRFLETSNAIDHLASGKIDSACNGDCVLPEAVGLGKFVIIVFQVCKDAWV